MAYEAAKRLIDLNKIKTLPYGTPNVVQTFCVSDSNIYLLQNKGKTGTTNIKLTRIGYDYRRNIINYNDSDYMMLNNFGHTQTLELDEQGYLWVGTKSNKVEDTFHFTTQLARISYQAGKTINGNTDTQRLSSLNWIDKKNEGSKIYRTEAALSTDKKTLMIMLQYQSNATYLAKYDMRTINDKMNAELGNSNGYVAINGDSSKEESYNKTAHLAYRDAYKFTMGGTSIQGFALTQGATSIYMSSGSQYSEGSIYKMSWGTRSINSATKVKVTNAGKYREIEDIEIPPTGSNLMVSYAFHNNPNDLYIYSFAKSNF